MATKKATPRRKLTCSECKGVLFTVVKGQVCCKGCGHCPARENPTQANPHECTQCHKKGKYVANYAMPGYKPFICGRCFAAANGRLAEHDQFIADLKAKRESKTPSRLKRKRLDTLLGHGTTRKNPAKRMPAGTPGRQRASGRGETTITCKCDTRMRAMSYKGQDGLGCMPCQVFFPLPISACELCGDKGRHFFSNGKNACCMPCGFDG